MKRLFKAVRQNDLETIKRILDTNPELINCVSTPPPKKDNEMSTIWSRIMGCLWENEYIMS